VFQGDFRYTCTDTQSGKTLWSRVQDEREGSPIQIFVSNAGWTVIRTSGDMLIFVNVKGKESGQFDLLGAVPKKETDEYVVWTTAGRRWSDRSHWYFVDTDRPLFVIRCWWDTRIIVDLESGSTVQPDKSMLKILNKSESEYAVDTLKAFVKTNHNQTDCDSGAPVFSALTAVHLAGRMKLRAAIPYLRKLENSERVMSSGGGTGDYKPEDDQLNPGESREYTIRQSVHLTLRRLGVVPGPFVTKLKRIILTIANRTTQSSPF